MLYSGLWPSKPVYGNVAGLVIGLSLALVLPRLKHGYPWCANVSLMALAFYLLGSLCAQPLKKAAEGPRNRRLAFAALGAACTVLDYSPLQCESEKQVANREGYAIQILRGDMTQPLPFPDDSFDLIFHPVSNCYVREVKPIWRECFRVLRRGGELLSGTDHFVNYIVDENEERIVNSLPFDPLQNPEQMAQLQKDDSGVQFSHTLEEQINGQLEAGFQLLELYEDTNGKGRLHALHIPCFLAMRSRKP